MKRWLSDWGLTVLAGALGLGAVLWLLSLGGCASIPKVSLCATGEDFKDGACVCKEGHVKDDDGKGCHVATTTTTTTTSTTTTTTSTTLPTPPSPTATPTPRPPTPPPTPPPAPTPAPCGGNSIPGEPVSVRGPGQPGWVRFDGYALAPSSCAQPSENMRCFKDRGDEALYEADEASCWSYPLLMQHHLSRAGKHPTTLGGKTMFCEEGYPGSFDADARQCSDAYGRRVRWEGRWVETTLADRFSGFWHGHCPPKAAEPCPVPTPEPSGTCSLPTLPESGANGRDCAGNPIDSKATGIYGCCRMVEDHGAWAGPAQFGDVVEDVLSGWIAAHGGSDVVYPPNQPGHVNEPLETAFMEDIVRRLRARGLCATRGGPSDEIGIKGEQGRSEQFDILVAEGKVRRRGYVAVCRPARF